MATDPSKPTADQRIDRLKQARDTIVNRVIDEGRSHTPTELEELNRINRELDRAQETPQERAEREAREEESGLSGEEIDHLERADDAGLTPEELDARDQRERDEASGLTGEQLDARDGLIPTTGGGSDTGGGSGGGSSDGGSSGGGSGGSGGGGTGDGGSGGGDGDGGSGGGDGVAASSDGGDDNPHGGQRLPGAGSTGVGHLLTEHLSTHGVSGLEAARLRAAGGVTDPNPEAADDDDDNPKGGPRVTGVSSTEARRSPVPRKIQTATPHVDPRVTDPNPEG